ncbi:MAG TPA: hypothetical protein VJS64_05410 [Pyrinomonadaceae bacterium]|nr:hypothetical protein [Pyrinomonadaceae bacterium]
MSNNNTGSVTLELRDVYGRFISGDVELRFRNLKVHSFDFMKTVTFHGAPVTLVDVPAFPNGNWNLEIFPRKYRIKTVFVEVPSNGDRPVTETFFVNAQKAEPLFPSANEINTVGRWSALREVLARSTITYANLDNEQKAGLLNLFAKMNHPTGGRTWANVVDVFAVKPARIFARVDDQLWPRVQDEKQRFREQPDNGTMHKFDHEWTRLPQHASFKTNDPMGNLQLTFANDANNRMAVDADLDDHQGLKHAFDVIKHKFSGDTNPYDIHEVLVKFQDIDPGYSFA